MGWFLNKLGSLITHTTPASRSICSKTPACSLISPPSGPLTVWDGSKVAGGTFENASSSDPRVQGGLSKVTEVVSTNEENPEKNQRLGDYNLNPFSKHVQSMIDVLSQRKDFDEARMRRNCVLDSLDDEDYIVNSIRELSHAIELFQVHLSRKASRMHQKLDQVHHIELFEKLDPAEGARYTDSHRTGCMPDTRVDTLTRLLRWATDSSSPSTFWMSGMDGIGKTTIAHSFCRTIDDGHLGASFFCSQQSQALNDVTRILPTVAYQLAHRLPLYREALVKTLKKTSRTSSSYTSSLPEQVQRLFLDVQDELTKGEPLVVVIDALDECAGTSSVNFLLSLVALSRLPLKFLVTSRPETKSESLLTSEKVVEFRLDSEVVQEDILRYLTHELFPVLKPVYKKDTRKTIHALAEKSRNLFLFASTAARYIVGPHASSHDIQVRFSKILSLPATLTSITDDLHEQVLVSSYHNKRDEFRAPLDVLLCLRVPQSIAVISALLNDSAAETLKRLQYLSSVLRIPFNNDKPVLLFNPSFSDYIIDHRRSGIHALDVRHQHNRLALACLELMNGLLSENMCGIEGRETRNSDLGALAVQERIPSALQYASVYWASHLSAGVYADPLVFAALQAFVNVHLLHWLECLSLIGKLHVANGCVQKARLHLIHGVPTGADYRETQAILLDAEYMISQAYHFLHLHALEVYVSALDWLPIKSILRTKYMGKKARVTRGLDFHRDACSQTLRSTGSVSCLAFLPNGTTLVCGTGTVAQIWNLENSRLIAELIGHDDYVTSIASSPDATRLASASDDRTVRIWAIGTGELLRQLSGHEDHVNCVVWSPDGIKLLSGSDDKTVRMWNADTGELIQTLSGHTSSISSVAFSTDMSKLVSASHNRSVRVWMADTGELIRNSISRTHATSSVTFSPDMTKSVSISGDGAQIWITDTGELIKELVDHTNTILSVAFSPDGFRFVTGSYDKTIRVWDSYTGELLGILSGHAKPIRSVEFSPDGTKIASGSDDDTVRIWDANSITHTRDIEEGTMSLTSLVTTVTFSPDESKLASGSSDGTVHIWDTSTGIIVRALLGHTSDVTSVSFSPDGSKCVSGSDDATVRVWNVDTGKPLMQLRGHKRPIRSVAYSSDGRYLASGSDDRTAIIWVADTGVIIDQLEGFTHRITSVGFPTKQPRLVFGSEDGLVRVWAPNKGILLDDLKEDPRHTRAGLVAYPTTLWADMIMGTISSSEFRFWSVCKPAPGQCCLVLRDRESMHVYSQLWIWGSNARRTISASSFSGRKACLGYSTGEIVILELPDDCFRHLSRPS